jgi:Fe-Mn family superoxide dismutase
MNLLSTFASTLGYEFDALEPVLSRETVQYHFIQHQRRCYERTAAMVKETELESIPLESLVRVTGKQPGHRDLFTMAAEAWNHELYWRSLRPAGGGAAWGPIAQSIQRCFGDFSTFLYRAKAAAHGVMGSGWLWVTWRAGKIEVITTGKTDSPILQGHVPLLAIDLWEHAYYLDYYGGRAAYVSACLGRLIDWGYANKRLLFAEGKASEAQQSLRWVAWGRPKTLTRTHTESDEMATRVRGRRRDGICASDCRPSVRFRGPPGR